METNAANDLILLLCKLLFALFGSFVLCIAWYFREYKQSTKDSISQLRTDMEKKFDQNREDHGDMYDKIESKEDRRIK